jgi:hypothetical protein
MAKDLIIGVVSDYNWDKIKYWANSIDKSGFAGHKALIVYNMDAETVARLEKEQFMMIGADSYDEKTGFTYKHPTDHIMVDRFFHIYNFLNLLGQPEEVNRVIITDVRDVVFQDNPTTWLDENLNRGHELVLGSENLKYKDEPWGANNMRHSFGQYFYDGMADEEIFCAGVIAGAGDVVKDFCLNLWLICRGAAPKIAGGGGPDQAAMNIMIGMEHLTYMVKRTTPEDGWVVHAGTSMPAIEAGSGGIGEAYKQNPNMDLPFIKDIVYDVDKFIRANEKKLTIVHQWDRVPEWKALVEEKYGD